jgi:hypothetical protein
MQFFIHFTLLCTSLLFGQDWLFAAVLGQGWNGKLVGNSKIADTSNDIIGARPGVLGGGGISFTDPNPV